MSNTKPDPAPSLTLERVRADIARILQADEADIADTDNLIDHGLDSIRLMALTQEWQAAGAPVTFDQLAAWPEINYWFSLLHGGRPIH
jgi:bifunctional isochorismate lyase/aryl carrier protein|nr:MAG: hypothetical protein DIU54_03045 [Acidobacteriota bacterium]